MEYLVTMTTHVPDGTPEQAVQDIRTREAAHSRELAAAGHLLRLWRPPLQPGEWRTLGLFAAADGGRLEEVLASMPLRIWRTDEVTPLAPHPNDPDPATPTPGAGQQAAEFLVTFTLAVPPGTPAQAVQDTKAREAQAAHDLAGQGHLLRLWTRPDGRALGLYQARDAAQMQAILQALPLAPWMTVDTTPLSPHPSDPGIIHPPTTAPAGHAMNPTGQKVAIITGGSQGIGASLVTAYRRQGWGVVATARTMKPTEDPDMLTVDGDIADPATADRIIAGALGRFGRIDTLVNNAGVYVSKPFTDYTAEDYALVVGVNLTGFFWLTQRAIAEMLKRYGGHVVNISATLAEYANSSAPSVLTALTKGGLASATRSLAVEYASRGIRVNAVSPGIIQTPMHPADSYDGLGDRLPPLGRVGQVSDVVDAILFLEASPYITGEILHIDGGQTAGH